ncbi:MAG: 30S ribosome-binding factor RbfA [Acidobacteriota bacterium]|nr:30S ribosome-binding factor RbfA [Acidobacteriota bacterium]
MQHRRQRFEGQIQREISRILIERMNDPRLGMVSVTAVRASADLKHASVRLSIHGDAEQVHQTLELLARASGFVRHELGSALRLRYVPELEFHEDEDLLCEVRVTELLGQIRTEEGEA